MIDSGRFSIIPARAFDDTRLSAAPLKLLGLLGCYANRDGWCWPAINTLAARMGQTHRAIQKNLYVLRDLGYVQVRTNSGKSSHYKILHDVELPEEFDRAAKRDNERGVRDSDARDPRTFAQSHERGVRGSHERGVHPERTKEHTQTTREKTTAPPVLTPSQASVDFDALLYQAAEGFFGRKGRGIATKAKRAMGMAAAVQLFHAARTKTDPCEYIMAGIRRGPPASNGQVKPKAASKPQFADAIAAFDAQFDLESPS